MAWILCIETATKVCSVALARENELFSLEESMQDRSHAADLTVFIERLLKESRLKVSDLDAVAVSIGPGSYTGLRIGVSVAKGLAYGSSLPVLAIDTLQAMASGIRTHRSLLAWNTLNRQNALYAPMIDARRMEVFTALFDASNQPIEKTCALVVKSDSFRDELDKQQMVFFGDGALKCKQTIQHPNAFFVDSYTMSAEHMIPLAWKAFQERSFVDTAYFEPFYLKDFIATVPKNKLVDQQYPGQK